LGRPEEVNQNYLKDDVIISEVPEEKKQAAEDEEPEGSKIF